MPKTSSSFVRVVYPRLSREELLTELRRQLPALKEALPLTHVILFGSWAIGRATASSDVDLLVIYAGPARDDAYRIVWRCLRVRRLEPHVYSEGEAARLQSTLDRMTRNGIRLL